MDNINWKPRCKEINEDILRYAASKLPDVDTDALADVIGYTVEKCTELVVEVIRSNYKSYVNNLEEPAGKEIHEND